MAQRPIWRGHLRLALVTCPVALYNAHHERNTLKFNLINPETGNRIRMVTQDAETEQELKRGDLVKGFEYAKNAYLLMTEEDFAQAKIESSSTIMIDKFVPITSINPIYYDGSYFLAPDGDVGRDVYAVLRDALKLAGRSALARVVISQRERAITIVPAEGGLIVHTLHDNRDLNQPKTILEGMETIQSDPEMVKLAVQLIERQVGQYDPADVEDRYETRLRAIIDAKLKGEGINVEAFVEANRVSVADLMAALRNSLNPPNVNEEPAKPKTKRRKQS